MAPSDAERNLLDRLNALKPSTVTLQKTQTPVSVDAPISRADALAARLKSLRQGDEDRPKDTRARAPSQPQQSQEILDDDPLHFDDEQALNDFLQDLAEEADLEPDCLEAKEDDDLILPSVPSKLEDGDEDEADDEQKVANLLKSLGGKGDDPSKDVKDSKDDPDDSDGDDMGREVRRVMARAQDEADVAAREADTDKDDDPLDLPAVPTQLVDPADPADDIAARLAALKGFGGRDAGLGHTDAFGLPSAPTFQPGDSRRVSVGHGHGRVGYTDEDQRSWCVVCLEDAVVRCLGCDDDPYCARCWREMHVGPAAGFDERGHKRVPIGQTKH